MLLPWLGSWGQTSCLLGTGANEQTMSSLLTQCILNLAVFLLLSFLLQAEGDYYTRDEIVTDYPHLRQL